VFLDGVFEGGGGSAKEDGFDADAAIMTGELGRLVPDLLEALGGEAAMSMSTTEKTGTVTLSSDTGRTPTAAEIDGAPF